MIFVTVGTHEAPFDRLVRAVEQYAATHSEQVVLQRGYSSEPAPHCVVHSLVGPSDFDAFVRDARIVVTHAGPASILLAMSYGHVPVVVPRDPAWAEHIDSHQLAFARRMSNRVQVVLDTEQLAGVLDGYPSRIPGQERDSKTEANTKAFSRNLGHLVSDLVRSSRERERGFVASTLHSIRSRIRKMGR